MKTIRDTWLIFHRSLVLTLRQPTWVVFGMMLPILYLVLFGPLLEGAVKQAGAGTNAFNWFVPGLIIQIAIFGTAFGGFGLIAELRNGVVERMRVTPMSRASMLLGRSLRDVVILMLQALIMIVLAIPFGLVIQPGSIVAILALLVLIGLSVAPLTTSVMTSPATWRFSSSAVPSATITPWSMIASRSARASASSR